MFRWGSVRFSSPRSLSDSSVRGDTDTDFAAVVGNDVDCVGAADVSAGDGVGADCQNQVNGFHDI